MGYVLLPNVNPNPEKNWSELIKKGYCKQLRMSTSHEQTQRFHTMNSDYRQARFVISAMGMNQLPENSQAEVVFAGCSNAGKSSVINTLTGQNKLARVSKTPGRTQSLNYFEITSGRWLVDLPGYGFSSVSSKTRQKWQRLLDDYFHEREALHGLILVMDVRHPLKDYDIQMIEFCSQSQLPVHLVLTKGDKLKRGAAKQALFKVQGWLKQNNHEASVQLFSSLKRDGIDELHTRLDEWLGL